MENCKAWSFLEPLERFVDEAEDTSPLYHIEKRYAPLDADDNRYIEKAIALINEAQSLLSQKATNPDRLCEKHLKVIASDKINFFRKRGGIWTFRYLGNHELYLKNVDKGCEYINWLLANPGTLRPIDDIVCAENLSYCHQEININSSSIDSAEIAHGFEIKSSFPLGYSGDVTDQISIDQYHAEAQRLFNKKEEAIAAGEMDRVPALEEEMNRLTDYIRSVKGRNGRIRKSNDVRKRVRDAFRKSVRSAIEEIRKYDPSFAEHLDATVKFGNEVGYLPKESLEWELRPITNK